MTQVENSRDVIAGWRAELDQYFEELKSFSGNEPDDIFMRLAAITARMSEIRKDAVRIQNRTAQAFRTQEVDPFLSEADRQFKYWSRVQAVRDFDSRLAGNV